MACPGSSPYTHPEKVILSPSQVGILYPDKLGCITSCQGDETDPTFTSIFSDFRPRFPDFCKRPRIMKSVIGLVPVEHTH